MSSGNKQKVKKFANWFFMWTIYFETLSENECEIGYQSRFYQTLLKIFLKKDTSPDFLPPLWDTCSIPLLKMLLLSICVIFVIQTLTPPFWPRKKEQQLFIRRSLYRCYFLSLRNTWLFNLQLSFGRRVFSLVVNEGHYDILNTCDDDRLVVKAV